MSKNKNKVYVIQSNDSGKFIFGPAPLDEIRTALKDWDLITSDITQLEFSTVYEVIPTDIQIKGTLTLEV